MFNRERTLQVFGYDLDLTLRRRTQAEINAAPKVDKKGQLLVIDNCPQCGNERTIKLSQSKKNKLCSKCFHNQEYVLEAKRNQDKNVSDATKQKMRDNHWLKNGGVSPFKGCNHSKETKATIGDKTLLQNNKLKAVLGDTEYSIQMACKAQHITREEFNGFTSPENVRIRQSPEGKAWSYDVLGKADFTCSACKTRGGKLTAHHLMAFNAYPELRFDVENGVCLCHDCHDEFHTKYGRGDNTRQQYEEWLVIKSPIKPTIYLLIGAPSAGKSWVANQLLDKFEYVSYDQNRKKTHLDLLSKPSNRPKLYDPTFKIGTVIRRNPQFNFVIVCIQEDEATLQVRMAQRGGQWTDTVMKRNEQVRKRFEKYGNGGFIGTAQECLEYLKQLTI